MPEVPHIAVVDDNRSIRNAMQDLLNAAGYSAFTFEDAKSFLGSSVRDSVACLVADFRMPGMTGLQLHEHLATTGKRIPTVIITAHLKEMTRERAVQAGIIHFLSKPFTPDELLECVRQALANSRFLGTIPKQ
jgi:FixJ family two-component response regulator